MDEVTIARALHVVGVVVWVGGVALVTTVIHPIVSRMRQNGHAQTGFGVDPGLERVHDEPILPELIG